MGTNENGPGAAATAHRARIVASSKPTGSDNPNPKGQQSAFASPDKTARKQAKAVHRTVRLSLRNAIDAMCRSCIYDPEGGNGTWREQVQSCSSGNCPLHIVRPTTVKAQKGSAEARHSGLGGSTPSGKEASLLAGRLDFNAQTTEERRAA